MALDTNVRTSAARWGAVGLLVVAALGVGTLVAQAYEHASPIPHSGAAAPVPTFTLGVQTPTPTPTPTRVFDRTAERFLAVGTGAGSNVWWRGVAGACGGTAPVVERSTDGGETWTNVTPPDAAQLASIEPFDQTEADLVVGGGATCEPQALRTFTQGEFWEPSADVLATSSFITPGDPATVGTPAGQIAAPCAHAQGMRAVGYQRAIVCEGVAYASNDGGTWLALLAPDAVAVAIDGDGVLVAHVADGCAGLTLTRYASADNAGPAPARCAEGIDVALPSAIASASGGTIVWSNDAVILVP